MKRFLVLLVCVLSIYIIFNEKLTENFTDDISMLVFRKLDDSLIRMYKIGSSYNLYDSDIEQLFKSDDVIRMQIPPNYEATVIYKFENGKFAKTLQFPNGSYDLKMKMSDKIISQINVKSLLNYNYLPNPLYNYPQFIQPVLYPNYPYNYQFPNYYGYNYYPRIPHYQRHYRGYHKNY